MNNKLNNHPLQQLVLTMYFTRIAAIVFAAASLTGVQAAALIATNPGQPHVPLKLIAHGIDNLTPIHP